MVLGTSHKKPEKVKAAAASRPLLGQEGAVPVRKSLAHSVHAGFWSASQQQELEQPRGNTLEPYSTGLCCWHLSSACPWQGATN